jgi:hypothetical protein
VQVLHISKQCLHQGQHFSFSTCQGGEVQWW